MPRKVWEEFRLIFRNPREIHRILMVVPLAVFMSHAIYYYMTLPKGAPVSSDSSIMAGLAIFPFVVLTLWVLLSNPMTIRLFARCVWSGMLAILIHRIGVMSEALGGWYVTTVSMMAIGMVWFFTLTGWEVRDVEAWITMKLNEKQNAQKAKIYPIPSSTDANDEQSGTG